MDEVEKYFEMYNRYDELFGESMMLGLPEEMEPEEQYEIMKKCIEAGKDAVEMGYSKGYAGTLKRISEDGEVEEYRA